VVGYAKGAHREELFAHLLTMNLFCRETLGATLALDPASGELLLCRVLDLSVIDYQAFELAAEHRACDLPYLVRVASDLDAAGLASTADMRLCLDDYRTTERLGRPVDLIGLGPDRSLGDPRAPRGAMSRAWRTSG